MYVEGKEWILNHGERRLEVLSIILLELVKLIKEHQENDSCYECGVLIRDDDGKVISIEGGRIIENSKTWEDGAWYRLGCDTCDFELANEVY